MRVWVKDFDRLWQELRPTDVKPVQIPGDCMYKISPLPVGVTHADIVQWIALEKMQARPLRALNPTTWLLVGEANLAKANLTWKQNATLLQPVESRYSKSRPIILAGKRPIESTKQSWKPDQRATSEVDPWLTNDPWAQATPSWSRFVPHGGQSSADASSSTSGRSQTSTASSEANAKQQKAIEQMQSRIDSLESAVGKQQKETVTLRQEVRSELQHVRKEVSDKVNEVKDSFQSTLADALNQTQHALRTSFREDFEQLKQLLGAPPRKRTGPEASDMERD